MFSLEKGMVRSAQLRLAVFISVLTLPAAVAAAPLAPTRAGPHDAAFATRLDAAFRALETQKAPVIVAISHHGGPAVVRAFGSAAQRGLDPAKTLIDLNSITKTVTGVMIAALVDRGRLHFDARVGDLLESVPADKAAITVHQLLTHQSGLPESVGEDAECLSKASFLQRVFRTPLEAPPGSVYHYSNVGYGALAAIIEAKSRKSYEHFLREDVLDGLAIDDTGYSAVYHRRHSLHTARGQDIATASWGGHAPGWNLIGNGGLVSTVSDFVRFRQALVAGEILGDELRTLVETPHIAEDGGESFYGYGVVVQDVPGIGRVHWHDGGNDVYSAQWADYLDQGDLVVTAAADSRRGNAFDAMQLIATHLYRAPAD